MTVVDNKLLEKRLRGRLLGVRNKDIFAKASNNYAKICMMQSKNLNSQYEKINEQKYFCFCVSAILRSPRGGVLPYITYTGMCRPKGSWFWSSWFRTGYPFQRRFLERGIIFRTHESSTFVSRHLKLFKDRLLFRYGNTKCPLNLRET